MRPEERDGEAIDAEGGAARMGDLARGVAQAPDLSEMILMIVEAHAGGRALGGAQGDEELEFQRILQLADRHHLADAAEEGIARLIDLAGELELFGEREPAFHPALAKCRNLVPRADADIFAHAEGLQAIDGARGLMAEAVAGDVEIETARGNRAALRGDGIDRIASGGRQDEIGRCQRCGPVAAGIETLHGRTDIGVRPVQRADAAEEIGEALEIAGLLEMAAAHYRRESEDLRPLLPLTGDKGLELLYHILVEGGARIDAFGFHAAKQFGSELVLRALVLRALGLGEVFCDRGPHGDVHARYSRYAFRQPSAHGREALNPATIPVCRSARARSKCWR